MTYKILHFIDALGAGGAERQLLYLIERLNPNQFESHVLTTYDTFRHYEAELRALDIPLHSLHHGDLTLPNRVLALKRYARIMWQIRPDIVHSWLHYPNLIARAARPISPSHRLITSIRSEYSPRQQKLEQITSFISDFRIVNYTITQKPTPLYHIPNGIPLDKFLYTTTINTVFRLLMVARITQVKEHKTFLTALSTVRNSLPQSFHTILIGEVGDTQLLQELHDYINENDLQNIIQFRSKTYNISQEYQQSTVTVLPSLAEGFPNVILESLATGRPVIISEAANKHHHLIQHQANGWIFPTGNPTALAQCILTALNTPPAQLTQMGRHARQAAEAYNIEKTISQFEELYTRAVNDL